MCDILWSDPDQIEGWASSGRGAGYIFGRDTVEHFCHLNNFTLLARAHQLVMEGYKFMFNEKLVTVWSAPNYYYRCGNVASIMELDENLQKYFKIFEAAPVDAKANSGGTSVPQYFLWCWSWSSIHHWIYYGWKNINKCLLSYCYFLTNLLWTQLVRCISSRWVLERRGKLLRIERESSVHESFKWR